MTIKICKLRIRPDLHVLYTQNLLEETGPFRNPPSWLEHSKSRPPWFMHVVVRERRVAGVWFVLKEKFDKPREGQRLQDDAWRGRGSEPCGSVDASNKRRFLWSPPAAAHGTCCSRGCGTAPHRTAPHAWASSVSSPRPTNWICVAFPTTPLLPDQTCPAHLPWISLLALLLLEPVSSQAARRRPPSNFQTAKAGRRRPPARRKLGEGSGEGSASGSPAAAGTATNPRSVSVLSRVISGIQHRFRESWPKVWSSSSSCMFLDGETASLPSLHHAAAEGADGEAVAGSGTRRRSPGPCCWCAYGGTR
jgi:hypothetical protein